jgi:4-amino-4-deoxy-L-arabinose transferase-like glycosyltransferase
MTLLLASWALFLFVFAYLMHPMEEIDTAERDQYVRQVEAISNGELPRDPFHPLLYPLVARALIPVTRDAFAAARLASVLAAIALAWVSASLARRMLGAPAAMFSVVMLLLNFHVIHYGVLTTTDMLFAALSLATIRACLGYTDLPTRRRLAGVALLFSLSFFTRSTGVFLIVAVILCVWKYGRSTLREKLQHSVLFCTVAVIVLVPHLILTHIQFGSPFYTENWKNVAFKISGQGWDYFDRIPYNGAMEMLRESWKRIIVQGFSTLERMLCHTSATLTAPYGPMRMVVLYVGVTAGIVTACMRRRRDFALVGVSMLSYCLLVAFSFFSTVRLLLPVLTGIYAFAAYGLLELPGTWMTPRVYRRYTAAVIVVAATGMLLALPARVASFYERHPRQEVTMLRQLDARHGDSVTVMATLPHGWRHVKGTFVYLPEAFGNEMDVPRRFIEKTARLCARHDVDILVYGQRTRRNRPRSLLRPAETPVWMVPDTVATRVAVYRIDSTALVSYLDTCR